MASCRPRNQWTHGACLGDAVMLVLNHEEYGNFDERSSRAWRVSFVLAQVSHEVWLGVQHWRHELRALALDDPELFHGALDLARKWSRIPNSVTRAPLYPVKAPEVAAALKVIARDSPCLTSLSINRYPYAKVVDDVALFPIAAACRSLTKLNVAGCALKGPVLWALAAGCPQLTSLTLSSWIYNSRGDTNLLDLQPLGSRLLQLNLFSVNMNHSTIQCLAHWCTSLRGLYLGCGELCDARHANFGQLRNLNIESCQMDGLESVPTCPRLISLKLGDFDGHSHNFYGPYPRMHRESVISLAERCPLLEQLVVEHWDAYKGSLVELSKFDHLYQLTLERFNEERLTSSVGPVAIPELLRYSLDDDLIKAVQQGQLTHIELSMVNVSDAAIKGIARSCSCLHTLCIRHCMDVTDSAIDALATSACIATLEHLEIDECANISYRSFRTCCRNRLQHGNADYHYCRHEDRQSSDDGDSDDIDSDDDGSEVS